MKLLLSACLLMAPAFAQTSWQWRDDMRRVHEEARRAQADALRAARSARAEAARSMVRMRAETVRAAAHARVEARQAREQARRAVRESYRHERTWRF